MKIRIISALVMLAVFIPVLIIGKVPYAILMSILAVCGMYELINLRSKKKKKMPFFIDIMAYILVVFMTLNNYDSKDLYFLMDYRLMSLVIFIFLSPIVFVSNQDEYNITDALYVIASIIFIGLSFNLLILLRNYSDSFVYILYLFMITIFTDTFALVTGMYIGKHPLNKRVSPSKTIEGSVGGSIMGTVISSIFYVTVIDPTVQFVAVCFMSLCLSLIGQLGDLVFSSIKRYYGAKDFSNLIPGHGGVLDRLDSIIFVVLAFVIFIAMV